MDDDETARDAHRAHAELDMTDRAFAGLRQAMLEKIATSPIDAAPMREKMYLGVQILDGVRNALIEAVMAGEIVNYTTILASNIGLRPN